MTVLLTTDCYGHGDYCCKPDSGDCCGPGSWCCKRAGEHDHNETWPGLEAAQALEVPC